MLIAYLVLAYISFPPEELDAVDAQEIAPMNTRERWTCFVMALMIIGWVACTWVTVLTMQVVSMVGTVLLMFPGLNLIGWKEIKNEMPWDTNIMVGFLSGVVSYITATGAMTWIVDNVLVPFTYWPGVLMLIICVLVGCLLHIVIPMGSPVMTMLAPPFMMMCMACGISPAAGCFAAAIGGLAGIILPYDMLPALTLEYGYYSVGDFVKNGLKELPFICIASGILIFALCNIFFPV